MLAIRVSFALNSVCVTHDSHFSMFLIFSLIFSNLSSSGNTIFTEIWTRTSGRAREKMRVAINDNNKISKRDSAIKSTLIANALPTGIVKKHYDIKLLNIQQIIQRKRSSGNVISNKHRSVKCVFC